MLLCTYRLPHPVILFREVKLELQVEKPLVGRGHPGDDFTDLPDIGHLYLMAAVLGIRGRIIWKLVYDSPAFFPKMQVTILKLKRIIGREIKNFYIYLINVRPHVHFKNKIHQLDALSDVFPNGFEV